MKRLLVVLALAACSSNGSKTSSTTSSETGSGSAMPAAGSASTDPLASSKPGMGEKCGENDACAPGFQCISYYGIAGARGPQFKTCEIKCEKDQEEAVCPKGTHCVTIADGPGQVCR